MSSQTRRDFIGRIAAGGSAVVLFGAEVFAASETKLSVPPVAVFSKVYQELKLNFEDAASVTAEAGLDGVDCPVRPGGEVLPERVADDLPRYFEALRKNGLGMPLLTTAITDAASTNAEQILRTAKKLGTRWYRLGFVYRSAAAEQIREWRAKLKDLAALNKEIGIGALIQNHSPSGKSVYLAGDLSEMRQLVAGFDPEQIGVAFDIAHAIAVHGRTWRGHFDALQPHFKIAYVKDINADRKWVPFGEGEIGPSGYFALLKKSKYAAPFSLHIEYDWTGGESGKNRAALLKALKESSSVLKNWFVQA
jgi:sugar phosphate isomerase/epimerase